MLRQGGPFREMTTSADEELLSQHCLEPQHKMLSPHTLPKIINDASPSSCFNLSHVSRLCKILIWKTIKSQWKCLPWLHLFIKIFILLTIRKSHSQEIGWMLNVLNVSCHSSDFIVLHLNCIYYLLILSDFNF